ncbi:FtsK/SpoIIIE domain-containing protein [Lactococcus carnosus]|uniref:FtsK/SpoIIIE domain-containing protein n=1 Tax=Pseudolactococcus carnosus TaxID=2749961 RepID=UPI000812AB8F|nr:FtsK/SpoIIIE domain-containing protein [Lactococcus carnosus]SCA92617.1 conserved hypothetical protein with Ftsk domain-containing protein and Protein EssC domain [Lactococcus piscium]MCJ1969382.1 AAA family ATPase [Lactococcus carnosus]MCJ1973227.1 AAA family ATPase [Lactococcus carnosus]MCJ1979018.1 AAA family ATPase [Lactococcus carnosus]MCJ1981713.1 AAA family ATPase [Lactococcus carnosus]
MGIFEANEIETGDRFLIDNRLNPSDLIFVVYSLGDRLKKISLTQTSPSAKCLGSLFGVVNNKLHIDGWSTELGCQEIKGTRFLILSRDNARTYFFIFNASKKLVISSDEFAGIKSPGKTRLILDQDRLIVDIKEADVYYNDQKIVGHHVFSILEGASFLTPHYLLEKRPSQWKITVFSDDFTFEPNHVLLQKRKSEFPKDFPDYRRSPRLNLEVPTDKFKLQGSSKHQEKKGNSLLKMIMPPLMMIGMTGVTTLLSGRDALMMLGMGGASLLTTTFTVSQFFTEKKANKLSAIEEKENDLHYLVTAVGEITRRYKREKEVLAFQLPSPEKLVDMTAVYDSRIYERQVHNKDFLTVSLGTCDTPSSLTIETDVNDKDLSHEAKHLKTLAKQFSTQRQVPTAISLLDQTLGLVGAQDVLATSLENLLFQTAFFHSYRDVNFISLLSRKAYQETWQNWRLLPHFKLQELNMRGLIYNEKLRDALGQYELMYDPTEEVVQGKDTSGLPSQLDAVIGAIGSCFKARAYLMPDRPWLANLSEKIVTPIVQITQNSQSPMLTIPLGFLDIPAKQAQEVYLFDLVKQGHTVIFASPGYGKSTVLQTLVMNLARQNTPEEVQFNLLDFGTNGLLPLKDLPHVADLVTLEEDEKLQKMLAKLASELAKRKKLFKEIGVASLTQYETKTTHTLPVILTILDSYDSLDQNDPRKDKIDTRLIQLLRDGAGLGVYLILTAGRVGAVRPNMMSNISTKFLLYLNDENDVATIMGRDKLGQTDLFGRGQVMRELPTAIQFYLPVAGKNDSDLLANLEQEVLRLDQAWTGKRPEKIPMVPAELTVEGFDKLSEVIQWQNEQKLPLGMSYETTDSLGFIPGRQPYFLFAPMDDDQNSLFQQLLLRQISKVQTEVLLIDFNESFEETIDQTTLSQNVTVITDKNEAREIIKGMVGYGQLLKRHEVGESVILVISNIQDFIKKTAISASDFMVLLKNTYKAGLDIIIFGPHEYISKSFDDVPKAIRQLKFSGLIGSRIYDSALIKCSGLSSEPELDNQACYFVLRGGSAYDKIKLPKLEEGFFDFVFI